MILSAVWGACRGDTTRLGYEIVERLPHDTAAYTQGLLFQGGRLYESTGTYGHSQLRRVDLATGRVLAATSLPADRFGEGLAHIGDRLYQLTWQHSVGYIYDLATLALIDSFSYVGEGWGLTSDGTSLIMSDGSATLRFLNPTTFAVIREVTVQDDSSPLSSINELEYANGELFANVYQSAWLVRVDPTSGRVLDWIDLIDLVPGPLRGSRDDVLNGIAFDSESGHLLVTGKRWPVLYRVRLESTTGRESRRGSVDTRPNMRLQLPGAAK